MASTSGGLTPAPPALQTWRARLASFRQLLLRASDHACLWLIEEVEFDRKFEFGERAWDLGWCAGTLTGRLLQLGLAEDTIVVSGAHPADAALLALLDGPATGDRTVRLRDEFLPAVRDTALGLLAASDPLLDEGTTWVLRQIADRLGATAGSGAPTATDHAEPTGAPLPAVAVPDGLTPGRAYPPTAGYQWPDLEGQPALWLHTVAVGIEICAAEICAEAIIRDPDLPAGLRFDLTRQVSDELRHARLLFGRAADKGVEPFSVPYANFVWDLLRAARTTLDRITLEQRIGEAVGLDDSDSVRLRFSALGDPKTAAVFEFVTADEIVHVRCGNHWVRTLLEDDQTSVDTQENAVLATVDEAGLHRPSSRRFDPGLRRLAGFTEQEIQRRQSALDAKLADARASG